MVFFLKDSDTTPKRRRRIFKADSGDEYTIEFFDKKCPVPIRCNRYELGRSHLIRLDDHTAPLSNHCLQEPYPCTQLGPLILRYEAEDRFLQGFSSSIVIFRRVD